MRPARLAAPDRQHAQPGSVILLLRAVRVANPTTAALGLLVLVLLTASRARFWVAGVCAVAAMLAFNFFFLPPVGTFTIADPHNWIASMAFLAAAVIASQLSAAAQARAREAIDRRNELARLFDLSRDVLLTSDSAQHARDAGASHRAAFELTRVAICLPSSKGRETHHGGARDIVVDEAQLAMTLTRAGATLQYDARQRTYGGHVQVRVLIASLRKKIEPDLSRPRYIVTEPWVGYRFADTPSPA